MSGETDKMNEAPSGAVLFWVAAYLTQRHYGGHEEGGWWFDRGDLVSDPSIYADLQGTPMAFLSETEALSYAERLRLRLPLLNEGRRSLDSVLSDGVYDVEMVEAATLPTFYPEYRPSYE